MRRITKAQVAPVRERLRAAQNGNCMLCGMPLAPDDATLDHCHTTGYIRGALHRGCNTMLGKIENHRAISKLRDDAQLEAMLKATVAYIRRGYDNPVGFTYPNFKTEEEKRRARNAKARKSRAAKRGE